MTVLVSQSQESLTQQLTELVDLANKNGLYDAADYLTRVMAEDKPLHRPVKTAWAEPSSQEDAQTRRQKLITEIQDIEYQLGSRNREKDGQRVAANDWWSWRNKAIAARKHKLEDLRLTNEWIKTVRKTAGVTQFDDTTSALAAASKLLHTLAAEMDEPFDKEEQAIVDGIDVMLGLR